MIGILWFILGAAVGAVIAWLAMRGREGAVKATLQSERQGTETQLALVRKTEEELADAFDRLSTDALNKSTQSFLTLADEKIKPLKDALDKVEGTVKELEEKRTSTTTNLSTQLALLMTETANLSRALRRPDTAGSWGEIQLRRVVEMAGMLEHCDFDEKASSRTEDGKLQIPDLTVHLPNGAHIVIDSKVPRAAFLDAEGAEDEEKRRRHLQRHAQQVKEKIKELGGKKYWEQFDSAPECVVMFVPHEPFISAACREEPMLIEDAFSNDRVMIATPLTLIALLYGFAAGWRQVKNREHAEEIAANGRELYKRVGTFATHFREIGRSLNTAVSAYNATANSLESRLLPKAREFPPLLNTREADLEPLKTVDLHAKELHASELLTDPGVDKDVVLLPEPPARGLGAL